MGSLGSNDRVKMVAIDLQTVELTKEFVAPGGEEVQQALTLLRQRVPLGSTDLEMGLEAAANCFAKAPAGRGRSIAYIGDGMSTARLIPNSRMQQLVDRLVSEQISVDSYAIGPRLDNLLLGALANHTGGMLMVDTENWNAKQAGMLLATCVKEPVLWPQQVSLPASMAEVYPRRLPPLRFDRDTILIGRGKQPPSGKVEVTTESNGQKTQMSWQLAPQKPSEDNAYLADLATSSQRDGGLGLPLVGTAGLTEMRRLVRVEGRALVRLGQQAVATGALDQAETLAAQALKLDSGDPEALAIRDAVAKARKAGSRGPGRDLKLVNFQAAGEPIPAPAAAEPSAAAPPAPANGDFLDQVEQQNRVLTGAASRGSKCSEPGPQHDGDQSRAGHEHFEAGVGKGPASSGTRPRTAFATCRAIGNGLTLGQPTGRDFRGSQPAAARGSSGKPGPTSIGAQTCSPRRTRLRNSWNDSTR